MTTASRDRSIRGVRSGYAWAGRVPGDKSISHRSVLFSLMARGESRIEGAGTGRDVLASVAAARAFGAGVAETGGAFAVQSPGLDDLSEPADVISAENSGTTARLLLGVAAAAGRYCVLTGDRSLRSRPMDRVIRPLSKLGARIDARSGGTLLPATVRPAPLTATDLETGVASAQVKSAAILAALSARGVTSVTEPQPTRDHTERMLAAAGVAVSSEPAPGGAVRITVRGGQRPGPRLWRVPGDPSSAAFHVTAALLLGGAAHIPGVSVNPGRAGFLDIVCRMGAAVRRENPRDQDGEPVADLIAEAPAGGAQLSAAHVGADEVPGAIDELTLIGVLGALAVGRTEVRGAAELRVKESDRIACLVEGLAAFGVAAGAYADGFWVEGPCDPVGARVDPHGDHRMAMGFGLLALRAEGESVIAGGDAAGVSYPAFWNEVLGAARGG